jgi:hypothetical protein
VGVHEIPPEFFEERSSDEARHGVIFTTLRTPIAKEDCDLPRVGIGVSENRGTETEATLPRLLLASDPRLPQQHGAPRGGRREGPTGQNGTPLGIRRSCPRRAQVRRARLIRQIFEVDRLVCPQRSAPRLVL